MKHRKLRWLAATVFLILLQTACGIIPGTKPEAPTITVEGVRPLNLSLTRQKLAFRLRVQNPNGFDLPLQSLDFSAHFAGEKIAEGSSKDEVIIPANGEAFVEVDVIAGINTMLEQFRNMLDSDEMKLDYGVVGTVKLANWPKRIPFKAEGQHEVGPR
ncbi:MAG: LEA type 2 family protein [Granulosicoccus sp.]